MDGMLGYMVNLRGLRRNFLGGRGVEREGEGERENGRKGGIGREERTSLGGKGGKMYPGLKTRKLKLERRD